METNPDKLLDFNGVRKVFADMGLEVSERQVRRMFSEKSLPVFKWRNKFYITEAKIREHFHTLQEQATQPRRKDA